MKRATRGQIVSLFVFHPELRDAFRQVLEPPERRTVQRVGRTSTTAKMLRSG